MVSGLLGPWVGFDPQDPISQVNYTLPAPIAIISVAIHLISMTGKFEVLYNAHSYGRALILASLVGTGLGDGI